MIYWVNGSRNMEEPPMGVWIEGESAGRSGQGHIGEAGGLEGRTIQIYALCPY